MWKPKKVYQVEYLEGYDLQELLAYCVKHGLAEAFDRFMMGKTGGVSDDKKLIVFTHDWEKFMNRYERSN